jgi:hypothetical protein
VLFYALYPGHPPACAPAFTLCGTDVTGSSDLELDGIMDHAPGSRLIRRQGRQAPRLLRILQVPEQVKASNRTGRNGCPQTRQNLDFMAIRDTYQRRLGPSMGSFPLLPQGAFATAAGISMKNPRAGATESPR